VVGSHALDEDVDLRVRVVPVGDVELANLAVAAVDDKGVLGLVGEEVVVKGSLPRPFLGGARHHSHAVIPQAELLEQLQVRNNAQTCRGEDCGEGN
jgi:hypothetical protein